MSTNLSPQEQFLMACDLAARYHEGQRDRAGLPYIFHIAYVIEGVRTLRQKTLAALHDIIEDTAVTAEFLREAGFPDDLVDDVETLTYVKVVESREDYIDGIARKADCVAVKLVDLEHNLQAVRYGRKLTDAELAYSRRRLAEYNLLAKLS